MKRSSPYSDDDDEALVSRLKTTPTAFPANRIEPESTDCARLGHHKIVEEGHEPSQDDCKSTADVKSSKFRKLYSIEGGVTGVRETATALPGSAVPPDPRVDVVFGVDDDATYTGNQALKLLVTEDVTLDVLFGYPEKRDKVTRKLIATLVRGNARLRFVKALATLREAVTQNGSSTRAPKVIWECLTAKEAAAETVWFIERLALTNPTRPPIQFMSYQYRLQKLSRLQQNDVETALSLIYLPAFESTSITAAIATQQAEQDGDASSVADPLKAIASHGSQDSWPGSQCHTDDCSMFATRESHEDASEYHDCVSIDDWDVLLDALGEQACHELLMEALSESENDDATTDP